MVPSDLSMSSLSDALQDVKLLFLDGYSHEMAVAVASQVNNFFKCCKFATSIFTNPGPLVYTYCSV
jgi:hypothetical protein